MSNKEFKKVGEILKLESFDRLVLVTEINQHSSWPHECSSLDRVSHRDSYKLRDFSTLNLSYLYKGSSKSELETKELSVFCFVFYAKATNILNLTFYSNTLKKEMAFSRRMLGDGEAGFNYELKKMLNTFVEEHLSKISKNANLEETGANITPETHILEEVESDFEVKGDTLSEKFNSIVGEISELTKSINENTNLTDIQEIGKKFIETRDFIHSLATKELSKFQTYFKSAIDLIPGGSKVTKKIDKLVKDNSTIQKNIDILFGSIHREYEKLIKTGESLQKSRAGLIIKIEELGYLLEDSEEEILSFKDKFSIPMNSLSLNTQIKSTIEKYKIRLNKVNSTVSAVQANIIKLGGELPAMKTDLIDEMALSTLLTTLDNYQSMWVGISDLIMDASDITSKNVHESVENLLNIQINDTKSIDYIVESSKKSISLTNMLKEKQDALKKKVIEDSNKMDIIIEQQQKLSYTRSNEYLPR